MTKEITLTEWQNASLTQRSSWLNQGYTLRPEDVALIQRDDGLSAIEKLKRPMNEWVS